MTKRPPIAEIINGTQAKLLGLMRDAPGCLSIRSLMAGAGIGRTFAIRALLELREVDLAEVESAFELPQFNDQVRGRKLLAYSITAKGSRALARYQRKQDDAGKVLVEPARSNMFERPDYVPASRAFYRNAGNKHIQSRGFPC